MNNMSVIIPTLNRPQDLKKCLDSIFFHKKKLVDIDIIIIDQSNNQETKEICTKYPNIHHYFFNIRSLTHARNFWLQQLSEETNIVIFLDDDVTLSKDFFQKIESFFSENPQAKWWVANIISPIRTISFIKKIGLFLLTWSLKKTETIVTNGGFNVMPLIQPTTLKSIERASGCGMFFRKNIFNEGFRFEEKFMRYCLMEDCFLSYAITQKYPNSLYFVPNVHMVHHESPGARVANRIRINQNIVHRFYFVQKFNKNKWAYILTMLIFCLFDLITYKDIKIIKRYNQWLKYVFTNKRNFLKSDFDFNKFIFGQA